MNTATERDTSKAAGRPKKGDEKRQPLKTDTEVKNLKAEPAVYEHAIGDCPGLRIRVSPSGLKSWYLRARNPVNPSKLEKMVIGQYPAMSLREARERVGSERTKTRDTSTTAKERRDEAKAAKLAKAEAKKAAKTATDYTLAKMVDGYLKFISDPKNKGGKRGNGYVANHKEVARCLDRYILGRKPGDLPNVCRTEIGNAPAATVRHKDVLAQLAELDDTPTQYNRTLMYLKGAYNWTIRNEAGEDAPRVTANPCALIQPKAEDPDDRVLSKTEIRNFLSGLAASAIHPKVKQILMLITLTGLRSRAAANLSTEYVDAEAGTISIPADMMKSGRPFVLPLTTQIKTILDATGVKSGLYFSTAYGNAFTSNEIAREFREALPHFKLFDGVTPKTLRKTLATEISNCKDKDGNKIDRFIKSRLLDHADSSVTGRHYDRYAYLDEKRHWLQVWGDYIDTLMPADGEAKTEAA
ncbi:MAG TPA: integrase family protein [Gammaproteobacteria bacterium]|nr:integrase family protein [Gammaproteobacteria bacterium]